MAGGGGGEGDENPVPVNCVALIDIIFCLCIFFICSFHFKEIQGKLDSWLPRDRGPHAGAPTNPLRDEIRVRVHLAGMEAKDEWRKLDPYVIEVERAARIVTEATRAALLDATKKLEDFLTRHGGGPTAHPSA